MLLADYAPAWFDERDRSLMLEQTIVDIVEAEMVENTAIITIQDRLDVFNAQPLMREFDRLRQNGVVHFIVDLSAVRVVDGDGDYPLLHLLKSTQNVDGSVTLVCPPGNPVRIFYEMMRLNTLFEIVSSREEALNRLTSQHTH